MKRHQFLSAFLAALTAQALPAAAQAQTHEPCTMSPADMSKLMEQEIAAWSQKAGIKLD